MNRYIVLLGAIALSGCASFNGMRAELSATAPDTGQEVDALIGTMREAYAQCHDESIGGGKADRKRRVCNGFKTEIQVNPANSNAIEPTVLRFVDAGMTLSDFYCDRFFRSTNQSSRHRRHARGLTNSVGGAVATAMGLARVASGVVGGVAGGFALVDAEFRNYDDSFMVNADLSKMRRLVLSAQDNMKYAIHQKPPGTIFAAESAVLRYAGLCSFLGMQDLLNDSVAGQTKAFDKLNEAAKEESRKPDMGAGENGGKQGASPQVNTPASAGVPAGSKPDTTPPPPDLAPLAVPPPPPPA